MTDAALAIWLCVSSLSVLVGFVLGYLLVVWLSCR